MNVTVIVVELLIMFLVIGLLLINPVTFISDYPPEIQEIYYKSQNKEAEKEKLTTMMIIKKVVVLIVFICVDVTSSGSKNIYSRIVVNLYICNCIICLGYFFS